MKKKIGLVILVLSIILMSMNLVMASTTGGSSVEKRLFYESEDSCVFYYIDNNNSFDIENLKIFVDAELISSTSKRVARNKIEITMGVCASEIIHKAIYLSDGVNSVEMQNITMNAKIETLDSELYFSDYVNKVIVSYFGIFADDITKVVIENINKESDPIEVVLDLENNRFDIYYDDIVDNLGDYNFYFYNDSELIKTLEIQLTDSQCLEYFTGAVDINKKEAYFTVKMAREFDDEEIEGIMHDEKGFVDVLFKLESKDDNSKIYNYVADLSSYQLSSPSITVKLLEVGGSHSISKDRMPAKVQLASINQASDGDYEFYMAGGARLDLLARYKLCVYDSADEKIFEKVYSHKDINVVIEDVLELDNPKTFAIYDNITMEELYNNIVYIDDSVKIEEVKLIDVNDDEKTFLVSGRGIKNLTNFDIYFSNIVDKNIKDKIKKSIKELEIKNWHEAIVVYEDADFNPFKSYKFIIESKDPDVGIYSDRCINSYPSLEETNIEKRDDFLYDVTLTLDNLFLVDLSNVNLYLEGNLYSDYMVESSINEDGKIVFEISSLKAGNYFPKLCVGEYQIDLAEVKVTNQENVDGYISDLFIDFYTDKILSIKFAGDGLVKLKNDISSVSAVSENGNAVDFDIKYTNNYQMVLQGSVGSSILEGEVNIEIKYDDGKNYIIPDMSFDADECLNNYSFIQPGTVYLSSTPNYYKNNKLRIEVQTTRKVNGSELKDLTMTLGYADREIASTKVIKNADNLIFYFEEIDNLKLDEIKTETFLKVLIDKDGADYNQSKQLKVMFTNRPRINYLEARKLGNNQMMYVIRPTNIGKSNNIEIDLIKDYLTMEMFEIENQKVIYQDMYKIVYKVTFKEDYTKLLPKPLTVKIDGVKDPQGFGVFYAY